MNTPYVKALILAAVVVACRPSSDTGAAARDQAFSVVATSQWVSIYGDALAPGWSDWSWTAHDLHNPSPVSSGTASIAVTFAPWSGLSFTNPGVPAAGLDFLDLEIDGGANASATLLVRLGVNGGYGAAVALGPWCQGNSIPASTFARCQVPLAALGATASSSVTGVVLQNGTAQALSPIYVDDLGLSAATPPAPAPVPPAPTGVFAGASATAVSLSWTQVATATGYRVYRGAAQSGPFAALSAVLANPRYVDGAVAAGATYWYAITALDAAGEGPQSAPVSATVPPPPPPPSGTFAFVDPLAWKGNHAATLPEGGNTVWWNEDAWDVHGDTEFSAASYLTTMVQPEKGFHVDVHKAASTDVTSAAHDNATYAVGGDGSRGLGVMHLDFQGILSARLRNPMIIASEVQPGVVSFRATRFVTTGHWWEVSITPASRVTAGEWTAVPSLNAGLAGPFGTGFAVNTTAGIGNGHVPPEESVNLVFHGYPDVPCSVGWHVLPEVKARIAGTTYDVWNPVTSLSQLPPTDPSEIDRLYQYRLEYRPSGIDLYADWDVPGVLTLREHYPLTIPWQQVHVQLLGVAYQADHHPQAPCYQGQVRELSWGDVSVAPVQYARTSVAPRDAVTANVSRATGWLAYDVRDIQRFGPPTADGLALPNAGPFSQAGSMAWTSKQVYAPGSPPAPVRAVDLSVDLTADQAAAAAAQLLYDIRYTGTANLSVNGVPVGALPAASTVAAAGAEPTYSLVWVRRALPFSPSLLHAGTNAIHLDLVGDVALDRLQLEFGHAN